MRRVAETGSTNADLLGAAAAGAPDRSVLIAAHQTAGRGRLDRRWEAPPGSNVLMSILFREVPANPAELTWRVGIAAVDAARAVAGVEARLKWPNDVLVGGRKLAGVLAQGAAGGSVVVGLGLNVGWAPPGAARLGDDIAPVDVAGAVLRALDALDGVAPAALHARYRELLDTLGRRVRVELPGGTDLAGTAVDVEPDGRLVVRDDGARRHRVDAGDVVHVRPG